MNMIAFAEYSSKFDQLMMYDRCELTEKPDIKLKVPPEINSLIMQLKQKRDSGSRFITFALLDLDDSILFGIAEAIADLKNQRIPKGTFRRVSLADDKTVVSIVASSVSSRRELTGTTKHRTLVEKYRRKLNKSVGLGLVCNGVGTELLDSAHFAEFEWEEDSEMEKLVEEEVPFRVAPNVKLPGVNQPCLCGSGKKFKKCCKRKIEDYRRRNPFN